MTNRWFKVECNAHRTTQHTDYICLMSFLWLSKEMVVYNMNEYYSLVNGLGEK